MRLHVAAKLLRGDLGSVRPAGIAYRVPGLKWKLGIDHQRRRAVRHADRAVRARAVRQRLLEGIGAHRQAIRDNRLHARLAEGSARLLVGEDRLQADDVLCQSLDIVLCGIDDGETFLQPLQVFVCRLRLFADRRTDALRHSVQALVDRLVQFGLSRAEHFRHRRHPPVHLGLDLQKFRHAGIRLCRAQARNLCLLAPHLPTADKEDDQEQDHCGNSAAGERQHCGANMRQGEEERLRAGVHGATIANRDEMTRSKREQLTVTSKRSQCRKKRVLTNDKLI